MGGYGSGRWRGHSKRATVEDSWSLDVTKLARDGLLVRERGAGSLWWTNTRTGEQVASVSFVRLPLGTDGLLLQLHYRVGRGEPKVDVEEVIPLTTTRPGWGGIRWWFVCPLDVLGRPCARRVAKLYLPPSGRYFGCRHCYELTYTSCQESHQHDRLFARLARETGLDPARVKRALRPRR